MWPCLKQGLADDHVKTRPLRSNVTSVLIKRGNSDAETEIQEEDGVKTQGKDGHPQAKEQLRLPKGRRETRNGFSLTALRGTQP
jgi:hypothetical protein